VVKFGEQYVKESGKLRSLILYILKNRDKQLKTEIVKHCFLIDYTYAHLKNTNEGFTTTTYLKYFYGPYSPAIASALDQLEREGFLTVTKNDFSYVYTTTPRVDTFNFGLLDDDVKKIVEEILSQTKDKKLQEIKDEAYSKDVFKKAQFNEPIKFLNI
jgi:DNA-binding PadR family transcriptional regulator